MTSQEIEAHAEWIASMPRERPEILTPYDQSSKIQPFRFKRETILNGCAGGRVRNPGSGAHRSRAGPEPSAGR